MRVQTVALLLVFIGTIIGTAIHVTLIPNLYILPTVTSVRSDYVPIQMVQLPVASGSNFSYWMAKSLGNISVSSVLFGNVTLCCAHHRSHSPPPPALFVLTSTQASSWSERDTDPDEYITAATSANYSYSQGRETLNFRLPAPESGEYYFVVYAHLQETPTLHLHVSYSYVTESPATNPLLALLPISVLAAMVIEHFRTREFWRFMRLTALSLTVVIPEGVILLLVFTSGGSKISRDVGLATYGAQIQLFAIFAALAPILFVFFQNRKPSAEELKRATIIAITEILLSIAGMTLSFTFMISERFDLPFVIIPFFVAFLASVTLIVNLLPAAGLEERILKWILKD